MKDFSRALAYINQVLYAPLSLTIKAIQEEPQNADYGAGVFQLATKSIRFRVAKITPTKIGQFVAFWEKDVNNKNQAFPYDEAADLLVINTFHGDAHFGQFVFPKEVLLQQGILKTAKAKGKMAMRVYPSWEKPTSKQAIDTQKWQLPYFVEITSNHSIPSQELLKLYNN